MAKTNNEKPKEEQQTPTSNNEDNQLFGLNQKEEVKKSEEVEINPKSIKAFEKALSDFAKKFEAQDALIRSQGELIESLTKQNAAQVPVNEKQEINVLEDYLDEPVAFFSYADYYSCRDDFRNNRISFNPLSQDGKPKAIEFKRAYRWQQKQTNGRVVVTTVSQYLCRSKAELEWLKNHSLYGIKFFTSMNGAVSVDAQIAEKMVSASSQVAQMNDHAVIQRCKQYEIPLNEDLKAMRRELISKLAHELINSDKQLSTRMSEKAKAAVEQKDIKNVNIPV